MNRRSIILMLIGVIASIVGLLTANSIRSMRCADIGGQWDTARRSCRVAAGMTGESATQVGTAYLIAAAVALLSGFLLYRVFLVATGRGPGAAPR